MRLNCCVRWCRCFTPSRISSLARWKTSEDLPGFCLRKSRWKKRRRTIRIAPPKHLHCANAPTTKEKCDRHDLKFFDWIADANFAAFDDAAQHSTPAIDLSAQARTHFFHLIAGSASGADFEHSGSDAEALADR